MKTLCLLLSMALACAGDALAARAWNPSTPGVVVKSATFDEATGTFLVKAEGQEVVQVLQDKQPGLTLHRYAVVGEVRYEKVGGTGYLELWNVFPPARPDLPSGHYFTRSMDASGPMGRLEGESGWREFILPFDPAGSAAPAERLEFNVALPQGGVVWLRNVRLIPQFSDRGWSPDALVGAIGGTLLGLLAAVITMCVHRRKGLGMARAAVTAVFVVGVICLLGSAATAWYREWPVARCFAVLGFIALFNVRTLRRQVTNGIEELERRRMSAADA